MKKVILLIFLLFLTACTMKEENNIKTYNNLRPSYSAGQYYPADKDGLERKIERYLAKADKIEVDGEVKAIMVPHAGIDFSGQVAASSYKLLTGRKINTAVIVCNSHAEYFPGLAVDNSDAWETPLGIVEVDQKLVAKIVDFNENIQFNGDIFRNQDQTLEVQIPFLQVVLKNNFKIAPIFFGNSYDDSYKKLAQALEKNLGPDDIIIISTDMSHYPAYEDANRVDKKTLEIIKSGDVSLLENYIKEVEAKNIVNEQTVLCGIDGVKTIMELANLMSWDEVKILKYANSGDVDIGDKESVVGYGAMTFVGTQKQENTKAQKQESKEDVDRLDDGQKKELLKIAKETVESFVKNGKVLDFEVEDERLNWQEGAFVTLHKDGQLRGCIGQIVPSDKLLWQAVRDMAIAACSEDHRFQPVSSDELDKIDYEISVLSVPEKINDWQKIELGKHGVIVRKGARSGVFLPQVADETGWSLEEFLSQLCWQKAGLAPDCYKNDKEVELQVYTAQVFNEKDIL